jgi:mRNA interferase RelE/StbE
MDTPYKVQLSDSARATLKEIPVRDRLRIARKVDQLALNPRPFGSLKLKGEDNTFRIRSGDYRIVYEVIENRVLVHVLRVGHRKDIYR